MKCQGSVVPPKKIRLMVLMIFLGFFKLAQGEQQNPEDGATSPEITTIRVFLEPSLRQVAPGGAGSFDVTASCGLDPCPAFLWTPFWDSTGIENVSTTNLGDQDTTLEFTAKGGGVASQIKQMRLFGFPMPFARSGPLSRHFETFIQAFPAMRGAQQAKVTRLIGGKATVRILANADSPDLQKSVTEGPSLLVLPAVTLDFGSQLIGLPPLARTITLINRGDEEVVISEMQTTSNDTFDFSHKVGGIPLTIPPKRSSTYRWKFFPRSPPGPKTAFLNIKGNGAANTFSIRLQGESSAAEAAIAISKPPETADPGAEKLGR